MLAYQTDLDPMDWVMAFATGDEICQNLAYPLLAPRAGLSVLPLDLGLGITHLNNLLERYYPGVAVLFRGLDRELSPELLEKSQTRHELSVMRKDEVDELVGLLEEHRAENVDPSISIIVATACLGGDHLWRDMGFPSRQELSGLMSTAFPSLKAKNDKDMKWKRFFYKQLCEMGGGYVCRAPSCDQCSAYSDCFGPEE